MTLPNPIVDVPNVPLADNLSTILSSAPQPLVLLPVRLETRLSPRSNGGTDLYLRVYPDTVHVDTHEPALTNDEIVWGRHYWEETWRAAGDETAAKLAWRQLVERFDANRAAWIARVLTPLNPGDRPVHPVPGDQSLPTPIKFPAPPTKAAAWTRAPLTRVLPNRWWAVGYAAGQVAFVGAGNPIPEVLATGPDPTSTFEPAADGDLPIDPGMKWMVDFSEAQQVGMGMHLALSPAQASGLDFLLVFGVKSSATVLDTTQSIAQVFDAHHYTDGLAFIPQGTPSNNTAEAPSGFNSSESGADAGFAAFRAAAAFKAGNGSNADVVATALGLPPRTVATFASVVNGSRNDPHDARHMNRAVWPATWGYFLREMMPGPLTPDDRAWARNHFVEYVRACGPLPAIRIGRQPYGLLPVTSLSMWKPAAGQEAAHTRDVALRDLLLKLLTMWRRSLPAVPRVGRTDGDPEKDLTDIFTMDGLSSTYAIRHLMGDVYQRQLWTMMVPGDQTIWSNVQQSKTAEALAAAGIAWQSRLSRATYSGWGRMLRAPLVQAGAIVEGVPLTPNYIEWLLGESDLDNLRRGVLAAGTPKGLMSAVLRHALLQTYWTTAANLQNLDAPLDGGSLDADVVSGPAATPWQLLASPIAGVSSDPAWKYLFGLTTPPADARVAARVAGLLDLRESLRHLKGLPAADLQRLFAGALDLCAYRLDAWITSFATKRLAEMRSTGASVTLLGGYGWVTNLRPAPPPALVPAKEGQPGPLFQPANNPGFTHAPSLAQAATVAVLRSGHITHTGDLTADALAVDLSSERVRLANSLLDGVRQGQPLGALLGYRFERRLQDAQLAYFIPYFRAVAPLVANKLDRPSDPPTQAVEAVAANNVVDGLVLQRKWNATTMVPGSTTAQLGQLFGPASIEIDAGALDRAHGVLQAELNTLGDAVDALSDALLAETVHHAVQGDPLRTAATLDAIANGEAPPPELDVISTPRTGAALTHRLVVLFPDIGALPDEWTPPAVPLRSSAEPRLNAWAARLLGAPSRMRCAIDALDPATGTVLQSVEVRLSELALSPLDLVHARGSTPDGQPSEMEQRILYAARRANGFADAAVLQVNAARRPEWPASDVSFGELTEILRAAQALVTGARPLDGSELNTPEVNQPAGVDTDELKGRADTAAAALRQARNDLSAALTAPATGLDALRADIIRAGHLGIPGAVPLSATGDSTAARSALAAQAASIVKELGVRIDRLAALEQGPGAAATASDDVCAFHTARLKAVFGESFVVLPRFAAANAAEFGAALGDSASVQGGDPLAVLTWLTRAARVRDGVDRFDAALRYAEVLNTSERPNLRVAQLPHRANDRWVGLPAARGQTMSGSRFSVVVQAPADLDVAHPMAGLLVDEWVEVVPSASETTGVVFQFDQPDAAPPQSLLLAVPPDPTRPWTIWSLQRVLLETLDLARIRAVDPDALAGAGHYLPAAYFAVNAAGDTVSTDFSKLT